MATLAVFVVALPGIAQSLTEPAGEVTTARCYAHHKTEGYRSMDLFPDVITQVAVSQEFPLRLTVRNPWLHELRDITAYVNLSGAPGVFVEGGEEPREDTTSGTFTDGNPTTFVQRQYSVPVRRNASELYVAVNGEEGEDVGLPRVPDSRNDFDLVVAGPDGSRFEGPDPDPDPSGPADTSRQYEPTWQEQVRVPQSALTAAGPGDWTVTLRYRGGDSDANFDLFTGTYYNQTGLVLLPWSGTLGPNEAHTFEFTLRATDEGDVQALKYGAMGNAFYDHTDSNTEDEGVHDKFNTMTFELGSEYVVGAAVVSGGGADTLGPILRRWGQVLGFAGSFLILPSLVFGGTFGKGTVTRLNEAFGGPRRRVLFHNSMSFWLLGLSVFHMFLFLYESFLNWSHGLIWGGLSLACMIGLGVTGATQRQFVARWGFNRWRFIHFAMGILVFVFVLIHLTADGTHLAAVREVLFGEVEN